MSSSGFVRMAPPKGGILTLLLLLLACLSSCCLNWIQIGEAAIAYNSGLRNSNRLLPGQNDDSLKPTTTTKPPVTSTSTSSSPTPLKFNITYETRWFTQLTDHFTWSNQDTFRQRYLVNRDHWCGKNCPILFYCGNEGDIESFTNNTGWMWENAESLHAMLVFAEHRFYGQSMPYPVDPSNVSPNTTRKTLGYLSSEQALADYANLIYELKNTIYDAKYSPVIAVGGSYGGMLAAWMRMKYPNAVAGALAGSAPILQFPGEYECGQFNRIVTKDFENYSINCSQSIAASWAALRDMAATQDGLLKLGSIFRTCEPLTGRPDVDLLAQLLTDIWANLAMVDYATESTFLANLPAYPIRVVCGHLNRDPTYLTDDVLLGAIARASQVFTNYTGRLECLDIVGSTVHDPVEVNWDFQSCTEMVMPICSDGVNDMFDPMPFNLSSFVEGCKRRWGVETQVNKVKALYGDKSLAAATNIIFSSCSRDPWSAGCPQESNEAQAIHAIKIPGVCHHEDLRHSGPNDSAEVKKARQDELNIISDWIKLHYDRIKKSDYANDTVVWYKLRNNQPIGT